MLILGEYRSKRLKPNKNLQQKYRSTSAQEQLFPDTEVLSKLINVKTHEHSYQFFFYNLSDFDFCSCSL